LQDIHKILLQYFGYSQFRPLQEEIISCVLNGKDTLALLPTGGGKSLCFQVPGLAMEGLCIVVSPLIALMKDQVERLREKGISAFSIHSGLSFNEIDVILDRCVYDQVKFLYLAPERLSSEILLQRVKKMKVNLLAVDEAHCISQWGYDFRPSYLEIATFRHVIGDSVPIMALTATSTPGVTQDIQEKLEFKTPNVISRSFKRDNLSFSCFKEENKERKILQILKNVPGTAIIYVRNRKKTEALAAFLNRNKISASFYHAGLDYSTRSKNQDLWINNKVRVMVATNAFGMGIDKPDVRTVVHYDFPENPENYYQEAGRAGRDGKRCYAVLLFNDKDVEELEAKVESNFPGAEIIKRVYQALANFYKLAVGSSQFISFDFDIEAFIKTYKLPKIQTYYALKRLEQEGMIQMNEAYYNPSKVFISTDKTRLYEYQLRNPEDDIFIKSILRIYGGEVFSNYVNIRETEIANYIQKSQSDVTRKLSFLDQKGLLVYEKQKDKPQIEFVMPRMDASVLPLDYKDLAKRKELYKAKVDAMVGYATNSNKCRSLMLLEYFGEENGEKCGLCDVCLKEKKEEAKDHLEIELSGKIIDKLKEGPLSPEDLVFSFSSTEKGEVLRVLRRLVDSGWLVYLDDGRLSVAKDI